VHGQGPINAQRVEMKVQFNKILTHYTDGKRLLAAVSGGIDSMCLLHLLHESKAYFEVAHCNFQLRDEDSESDQQLVKKICLDLNIPFHTKRFETEQFAKTEGLGIQEAARDLRYDWFNALLDTQNLDLITTGHHADDQAETIVMNFIRGSGPAGLSGMQVLKGNRFRPFLEFTKSQIREIAETDGINFREDKSNTSTKYRRNRIRLEVNPMLEEINPGLVSTLQSQSRLMREVRELMAAQLPELIKPLVSTSGISIQGLKDSPYPLLLLKEIFRADNLSREQLLEILKLTDTQSGSRFQAKMLTIVRDREWLKVARETEPVIAPIIYKSLKEFNSSEFAAELIPADLASFKGPHEVWLDADLVKFPLTVRPWKEGDRFQPLGMSGQQKISDLLVQRKISVDEKKKVLVVCSGDDILWIPNLHASDKFKLTSKSKNTLHLSCK
jgi:tRNA(Ile)-lysidine synthase